MALKRLLCCLIFINMSLLIYYSQSQTRLTVPRERTKNTTKHITVYSSLIQRTISDDRLHQLYRLYTKAKNGTKVEEIGPKIFEKLFVSKVFAGVDCEDRPKTYMSDQSRPLVALASFPGAGSTWTRILLEEMTGIFTGSIYFDKHSNELLKGSLVCPLNKVFIVKTHLTNSGIIGGKCEHEHSLTFSKAIYVSRSPYNAILAEFNRKHAGKTRIVSPEKFTGREWRRSFAVMRRRYEQHINYWLGEFQAPVHIIIYENLQKNILWELYKVSKFIDFPVTFETLWCIKQRSETQTVYQREKPHWLKPKNLYSKLMKHAMNNSIKAIMNKLEGQEEITTSLKSYMM